MNSEWTWFSGILFSYVTFDNIKHTECEVCGLQQNSHTLFIVSVHFLVMLNLKWCNICEVEFRFPPSDWGYLGIRGEYMDSMWPSIFKYLFFLLCVYSVRGCSISHHFTCVTECCSSNWAYLVINNKQYYLTVHRGITSLAVFAHQTRLQQQQLPCYNYSNFQGTH